MRFLVPYALLGCLLGCHAVLGGYTVADDEGCTADCCTDSDCDESANQACDQGRCAIRCIDNTPCPPFSECFASTFCTEPIGTPCDVSDLHGCGAYQCRDRDAQAMPVAGYCPGFCNTETPCPGGYTCINASCYLE